MFESSDYEDWLLSRRKKIKEDINNPNLDLRMKQYSYNICGSKVNSDPLWDRLNRYGIDDF
jgi:hypothetical protein